MGNEFEEAAGGLAWTVNVDGQNSYSTYADSGEWTSAVALWWLLLDSPSLRVRPAAADQADARYAPWQGVLHLLAYGKGWTDPAVELEAWRREGYPTSDPVLRFLFSSFGPGISVLELYLKMNPYEDLTIRQFLSRSGRDEGSELRERSWSDGNLSEVWSHASAAMRTGDNPLVSSFVEAFAVGLFASDERTDDARTFGIGGAHVSPHFTYQWVSEVSSTFEAQDTIEFISESCWRVDFARYAGWYQKLHRLLEPQELYEVASQEPSSIYVFVDGIGCLGQFARDPDSGRLARVVPVAEPRNADPLATPRSRYGIALTPEMARGLTPPPTGDNLYVMGREEVGLAYSLYWEAREGEEWSRADGAWQAATLVMGGDNYISFLVAMAEGGHLDPSIPLHEAIVSESVVHEIQPWAGRLLLDEWDRATAFLILYAELGSLGSSEPVTSEILSVHAWMQLRDFLGEIFPRNRPEGQSDEQIDLYAMVWSNGPPLTADEVLRIVLDRD